MRGWSIWSERSWWDCWQKLRRKFPVPILGFGTENSPRPELRISIARTEILVQPRPDHGADPIPSLSWAQNLELLSRWFLLRSHFLIQYREFSWNTKSRANFCAVFPILLIFIGIQNKYLIRKMWPNFSLFPHCSVIVFPSQDPNFTIFICFSFSQCWAMLNHDFPAKKSEFHHVQLLCGPWLRSRSRNPPESAGGRSLLRGRAVPCPESGHVVVRSELRDAWGNIYLEAQGLLIPSPWYETTVE